MKEEKRGCEDLVLIVETGSTEMLAADARLGISLVGGVVG